CLELELTPRARLYLSDILQPFGIRVSQGKFRFANHPDGNPAIAARPLGPRVRVWYMVWLPPPRSPSPCRTVSLRRSGSASPPMTPQVPPDSFSRLSKNLWRMRRSSAPWWRRP